ncbi:hypothetical protein N6H14_09145 [Paenibacillus sp. CC-CFT747]|nr:hypothetical protein N6H14_09145 [Paenibacillus sp. CC-CFT747]
MLKPSPTAAFLRRVLQNGFFMKLIMTTALIAIIPGLISNCIAYYKVSQSFREETGTNKLQYLNQTINAIEMVLNRIKDNSNQLALNRSFQNFERFPGGSYYEELQGEISPENLSSLYAYLEAKKNSSTRSTCSGCPTSLWTRCIFMTRASSLFLRPRMTDPTCSFRSGLSMTWAGTKRGRKVRKSPP